LFLEVSHLSQIKSQISNLKSKRIVSVPATLFAKNVVFNVKRVRLGHYSAHRFGPYEMQNEQYGHKGVGIHGQQQQQQQDSSIWQHRLGPS
jgi:hypothetical protein